MEWRTIETAPKDGTFILLINEAHQGEHPLGGPYNAEQKAPRVCRWVKMFRPNWCDCHGHYDSSFEPTHWMPLPEPPE